MDHEPRSRDLAKEACQAATKNAVRLGDGSRDQDQCCGGVVEVAGDRGN